MPSRTTQNSLSVRLKKLALPFGVAAIAAGATNAFGGGSLVAIPPLGADTVNEARAISPDGAFVVGLSSPSGTGFLYNRTNGYLVQPLSQDGAAAQIVTGVGYRIGEDPYNPPTTRTELLLSGLAGFATAYHTVWMTTDGGTNWDYGVQIFAGKKPTVPVANGLAGSTGAVFYATWTDQGPASGDNWSLFVCEYSGPWYPAAYAWDAKSVPKPNSFTQMNGISSNGRAVGWRQNSGAFINYIADYNGPYTTGAIWNPAGLDGTISGQAYSVSADGTVIFGISPKGVATGITNYGYKAVFNTNFPGAATQLSIAELPNFPDTTGSTNLAIPYGCTPDGKFAVGTSYRGRDKAVLWDTSDANPANWTVTDLTDLAVANSILGNFTNLTYAYSIGTNASGEKVVVGMGPWSEDSGVTVSTRAFVMTVPTSVPFVRPNVNIATTPQKYTFTLASVSGKTYYLEFTTNLPPAAAWSTLGSTPGTGSPVTLTDLNPSSARRFYRVRIQ